VHDPAWQVELGDGPLLSAALHDGHHVREELQPWLAIDARQRQREEDPHTAFWTGLASTRIVARRSRFEVDLNRPLELAVYLRPEDAWGLSVWRDGLPEELVDRSRRLHVEFYAQLRRLIEDRLARWGRLVVFDLHSYNHRRGGPDGPHDDPLANPEINVGTGTMDRQRWSFLVDRVVHELREVDYLGRSLDVRENIRFFGGYFPRWLHESFPESVCAIALEVKKFFMDEWTGAVDQVQLEAIGRVLRRAAEGAMEELERAGG
jgi:N-formylglutamate amidohydrolase